MKNDGYLLLVEDNPDDLELTLRELRQYHLENRIEVARDMAEALDFLFRTGGFAEAIRQLGMYWLLLNEPLP